MQKFGDGDTFPLPLSHAEKDALVDRFNATFTGRTILHEVARGSEASGWQCGLGARVQRHGKGWCGATARTVRGDGRSAASEDPGPSQALWAAI